MKVMIASIIIELDAFVELEESFSYERIIKEILGESCEEALLEVPHASLKLLDLISLNSLDLILHAPCLSL